MERSGYPDLDNFSEDASALLTERGLQSAVSMYEDGKRL
jgi:hypothetical protein